MNIYDIHIAYVSWGDDGKKRPVMILEQGLNGIEVFSITTKYRDKSDTVRSKYYVINDWQQAGLSQESYIDISITITLPKSSIEHFIGTLSLDDIQGLIKFIKDFSDGGVS